MYETVIVHHHFLAIKCKKGLSSSPGPRRIFVLHTPSRSRYNTGGKNDVHYHKLSFGRYMAWTRSRVIQVTSIRSKTNRIHTLWTQFLEIIFTHDNLHREFYPRIKTPRARSPGHHGQWKMSWILRLLKLTFIFLAPRVTEKSGKYFIQDDLKNRSIVVCESPVIVRWNDVGSGISISDWMTPHNRTFVMLRNVLYLK